MVSNSEALTWSSVNFTFEKGSHFHGKATGVSRKEVQVSFGALARTGPTHLQAPLRSPVIVSHNRGPNIDPKRL